MEQDSASKQKTKNGLAIILCILIILTCYIAILFIKYPIPNFCDSGCDYEGMGHASIMDVIISEHKAATSASPLSAIITIFSFMAILTFVTNPSLALAYFGLTILLAVVIPIAAIIRTVTYCSKSKKKSTSQTPTPENADNLSPTPITTAPDPSANPTASSESNLNSATESGNPASPVA